MAIEHGGEKVLHIGWSWTRDPQRGSQGPFIVQKFLLMLVQEVLRFILPETVCWVLDKQQQGKSERKGEQNQAEVEWERDWMVRALGKVLVCFLVQRKGKRKDARCFCFTKET